MFKFVRDFFDRNAKTSKKIGDYFSWSDQRLEVRETSACGKGVFAKENIKKGERLAIFGGYVFHNDETFSFPLKFRDNCINVTEALVLGARSESELEIASFFNHSCSPNAGINGQIFLVAMRDIIKDEEVAFDYATTVCRSKEVMPYIMYCRCGSKNCRKRITDNDWKIKELQERYKGFFQFYLEEKINSLNKE